MSNALREGVHGGISTLGNDDMVRDSDTAEKTENPNERDTDLVDAGLSKMLGEFVGGHVTNKTFDLPFANGSSVVEQFTYDRFYYDRKILVDLFDQPYSDEEKDETARMIKEKRTYALDNGYKYLAVVGTEMPVSEVQKAIL